MADLEKQKRLQWRAKVRREAEEKRLEEEAAARKREDAIREAFSAKGRSRRPFAANSSELLAIAAKRSPRILDDADLVAGLARLEKYSLFWVRKPEDWKPHGKGTMTVFNSIASHLFAKYQMPSFFWSIFVQKDRLAAAQMGIDHSIRILTEFVIHIARGGSAHKAVKQGIIPVPLTSKMCHIFVTTPGARSVLYAVRRAQVFGSGGDDRFLHAWMANQRFSILLTPQQEAFWQGVIEWFCRNPMLPSEQIGPMSDYIDNRYTDDPKFTMKGRTPVALIRAMQEWHANLARTKTYKGKQDFKPSGFRPMDLDKSHEEQGRKVKEIYHMREILTHKALDDEGKTQKHCVYAYASAIEKGDTSIWALTVEDDIGHWRSLTLEVRKSTRTIVQCRGQCNRLPNNREMVAVKAWASLNDLQIWGR